MLQRSNQGSTFSGGISVQFNKPFLKESNDCSYKNVFLINFIIIIFNLEYIFPGVTILY
jgi:hypothetical protein